MIFISQKRHQTTALMNKSGTGGFPEKGIRLSFLQAGGSESRLQLSHFTLEADMWENDRSRRKMAERKRQIQKRITVSAILTAVVLVLLFVFFFHIVMNGLHNSRSRACCSLWINRHRRKMMMHELIIVVLVEKFCHRRINRNACHTRVPTLK